MEELPFRIAKNNANRKQTIGEAYSNRGELLLKRIPNFQLVSVRVFSCAPWSKNRYKILKFVASFERCLPLRYNLSRYFPPRGLF